MARIRTIKPEFWTDEKLTECSLSARLLFIGTWNFADDNGNLDRSSKQIKARVFPIDNIDCEPLIQELIKQGLLIEYSASGKKYLHVQGFIKHQVINRPSKPTCPLYEHSLSAPASLITEGKGMEGNGKDIPPSPIGDVPPEKACTFPVWLERIKADKQKPISSYQPVWNYARTVGIADDWIHIAWLKFLDRYTTDEKASRKRYKDWRGVFLRAIKDNWFNIWYARDGNFILTTTGYQADIETREQA